MCELLRAGTNDFILCFTRLIGLLKHISFLHTIAMLVRILDNVGSMITFSLHEGNQAF